MLLVCVQVLRHSAELRAFLEAEAGFASSPVLREQEGSLLQSAARLPQQLMGNQPTVVTPAETSQPAKASRDLFRWAKELKQTMQQSTVLSSLGAAPPPSLIEDHDFLTHKVGAILTELDRHLTDSSKRAEALVSRQQSVGDVLGELGMALIKLANYEDNEGVRRGQYSHEGSTLCNTAAYARTVGRAAVRLARLRRAASAQTVQQLAPLHDYLSLNCAIRKALTDRTQALLTARTLEAEVKTKTAKVGKLDDNQRRVFGGDKNAVRRAEELAKDIRACEASHRASVQEYERIKERNLEEWERVTAARRADLSHMLSGFARVEAAYAARAADVWRQVAEELGADVSVLPPLTPA
jgi:hypothetical protein